MATALSRASFALAIVMVAACTGTLPTDSVDHTSHDVAVEAALVEPTPTLDVARWLPAAPAACLTARARGTWEAAALHQGSMLARRFDPETGCSARDPFARTLVESMATATVPTTTSEVLTCQLAGVRDGTFAVAAAAYAFCAEPCDVAAGRLEAVLWCKSPEEAARPLSACLVDDSDAARCATALVVGASTLCPGKPVPASYAAAACPRPTFDGEGEADEEEAADLGE
jgi:hypothetical protein